MLNPVELFNVFLVLLNDVLVIKSKFLAFPPLFRNLDELFKEISRNFGNIPFARAHFFDIYFLNGQNLESITSFFLTFFSLT